MLIRLCGSGSGGCRDGIGRAPTHGSACRRSSSNARCLHPGSSIATSPGAKLSPEEPDAGNLHVRVCEGRGWQHPRLLGTGEILASELTTNEEGDASQVGPLLDQIPGPLGSVIADGAYDGEPVYRAVAERQPAPPVAVIIPPRSTAVPSAAAGSTPRQRDQHIQMIQDKGRLGWQTAVGYGRRSLGETAMSRYKAVIGRGLRARALPAQKTEARVGCAVLNRMTRLGMPVSQRIA